jgi:uncharacterized protein (TIGR02453 family)
MPAQHFGRPLFTFLTDLEENNTREWFQDNQERFENTLREPSLQFISDFGPRLRKISPHFNAIPKKVGGSLFRIHRDVRFGKDKTPYKTHVGIHFRHKMHKDAHAPGFYLHIHPQESFFGAGIWRPDAPALKKIRQRMVDEPASWKRAMASKALSSGLIGLGGDTLKRPPRGFDPDHALIEDLKRKDFIAVGSLKPADITARGFIDQFTDHCKQSAPLVKWLCGALEVPF